MARTEREPSKSPENRGLLRVDPADLMRDNPAALIVNKRQYDAMAGHFSTDMWEPPQVVRVATFSAGRGEVIKYFIHDGMTRTKYVNDRQAELARTHPDFQFEAKDVTDSILRNPLITGGRNDPDQTALTIVQYLQAVVAPTVVHSQIAADRISTHLINGWKDMVGDDLARDYSAIAALSLLGNPRTTITESALKREFRRPSTRFMAEETIHERAILESSLLKMAEVIREVNRLNGPMAHEIARSAFILVSQESSVIGGGKEAAAQIYGMLHSAEVDRKLIEAFPDDRVRERMRYQLAESITEAFKRVVEHHHNPGEALTVLGLALDDPVLNFNHVRDIFESPAPRDRYDEVKKEVNADRLGKTYQTLHRTTILTSTEARLAEAFGSVSELNEDGIEALSKVIKSADSADKKGKAARAKFETDRDKLISQGVSSTFLDEIDSAIQSKIDDIAPEGVNNTRQVTGAIQRLNITLQDIDRRVQTQITTHKISEVVDRLAGDKLNQGYGPQIRSDIIRLILGEFPVMNDQNRHIVSRRVSEYTSLDNDLLLKIKSADITLSIALRYQRQREEEARQRANIQVLPVKQGLPSSPDIVPAVLVRSPVEAAVIIPAAPVRPPESDDVVSRADLDERRKQINREKLTNLTGAVEKAFDNIDLRKEDLTQVEQIAMDNLIRRLGRLAYGHPDLPREHREHEALIRENNRLVGVIAQNVTETAQRDSRTGR